MTDKPKVYVDSCCFIDAAKYREISSAPSDRQSDLNYLKQILKASEAGDIIIHTSSLTVAECQHVGDHPPSDEVKRLFKSILTLGRIVQLVSDSIFIAERARDLRWDHDITLAGADAIHIATALEAGCEEFMTFDNKGIQKNSAKIAKLGLKVIRPSETSLLPERHKTEQQPFIFEAAESEAKESETKPTNTEEKAESKPEPEVKPEQKSEPIKESE
jgi:predicted nucleic acid-binding protein